MLAQLRLLLARRLRVRPRAWQRTLQPACAKLWLQTHTQLLGNRCNAQLQRLTTPLLQTGCATAVLSRGFVASTSNFHASSSLLQRMVDNESDGDIDDDDDDDDDSSDDTLGNTDGLASSNSSSSKRTDNKADGRASSQLFGNARNGDSFAVDTLPALKVLAETFALMKQSPAFQNWNATDWLMGLTVLAQHNTIERRKKNVLSVLSDDANKKALENQELMGDLLKYVRVCDAVYASTLGGFCDEAGITRDAVVRHHSGGVFSPKFVVVRDDVRREIVVVVRGSASILDFCTDLCLVNEPFEHGQGHRGMVHAATWLAQALHHDLVELLAANPDYRVVTTGHSLGASVAALTTMLLRPSFPTIHCYAFATPASVTRELALACYDYVTTVVNGDDCVPRLHQHSIHTLQREVSAFDWRSTLKQLVRDEVQEQTTAVTRHKDAKVEQIYEALRKFEALSTARQHDAIEKIDHVKRLATENITELTSEIDRRVTASIDSTLATFRTDRIASNHIKFIQTLLKTDDKQKLPYVWAKLDASVLALERLSAAVNKPEELERLIRESKALLKHTSAAAAPPTADASPTTATTSTPATSLALFRDRINSVIDSATELLKSEVKDTMTQVTETVTSNVSDVVETVKVGSEAISSRIQSELDAAQRGLSETTEAVAAATAEALLPDTAPADSVASMFQDLNTEIVDLTQLFSSSSGSADVERDDFESDDFESDDFESDDSTAVVADMHEHSNHNSHSHANNALLHAPLFPPGRILYLNRVQPADSDLSNESSASSLLSEEVELVEVGNDEFSRVVLSNQMILDHLCTTYERMLQSTKILAPMSPQNNDNQQAHPPSQ